MEKYNANPERYNLMPTRRCGKSGVILPQVSLGLWHNFGSVDSYDNARMMLRKAFDLGIFHFDLASQTQSEFGVTSRHGIRMPWGFSALPKAVPNAHRPAGEVLVFRLRL